MRALSIILLVGACSSSSTPMETSDAATRCERDEDCRGSFCDGERCCLASAPGADARGCITTRAACGVAEICDEVMRRCVRTCENPDADGDGFAAIECGGNDCDDSDPNRFPGNMEVCDVDHVDEDCDPETFGYRDADGDGFPDARCCNARPSGALHCGTDCDDTRPSINPSSPDTCNGIDDDCDGIIDEDGATGVFFPDCDGDGFGALGAAPFEGCMPSGPPAACGGRDVAGWSTNATDCDDNRASVFPGAAEVCDGLDNDCDPSTFAIGEDDDGDGFADVACGGDDCDDDCPTCFPGGGPELCDGRDQDCDGLIDEGVDPTLMTTFYRDADGDGVGDSTMAMTLCVAPAGYVTARDDCDDGDARVRACVAPPRCLSERDDRVCGCRAQLLNNAQWLDLDTGTVSLVTAPSGGRDIMLEQGTFAQMYLLTSTGAEYRRYEPADFRDVDATYATGAFVRGTDPMPWTAATVYVIRTGSGVYKLGYFDNPGSGGPRFIYAPLGAPPAGFACYQ